MTEEQFSSFTLSCGLRVVVQRMTGVQSAALTLMVPAGAIFDQTGRSGTTAILAEMMTRGAGEFSARELVSALDNLGLQRSVSGGVGYVTLSGATTADRLEDAIPLAAQMVLKPHLTQEEFEPARELALQTLNALEDEPRQKLGHLLRRCSYPAPFGNPAEGTMQDLQEITLDDVIRHHHEYIRPSESVIGIAGNVDPESVRDTLESAFRSWDGKGSPAPAGSDTHPSPCHIEHDSAQTHIGLAWDTVPYPDERYFEAWAAVSLLSGGMSSRLFTEVREKRGLCYAISASINTQRDRARVFGYAGTTNDRAQETLDVTVAEVRRLHENITEDELQRCKARAKSALIMQQESTMARSGSLARDTLFLGQPRQLNDVRSQIDGLTVDQVTQFAVDHAPNNIVLVTIGPEPLNSDCLSTNAEAT